MRVVAGVAGFLVFVGALMAAAYYSSHQAPVTTSNASTPNPPNAPNPQNPPNTPNPSNPPNAPNTPGDARDNDAPQPLPALFVYKDDAADAPAVALAGARKRPALVHLWASWCGPCRAELPSVLALGKGGDVDVFAVSVDDHYGDVRKYFKGAVPAEVVWDKHITLERALGVENIPTTFVIDKRGFVVDRFDGAQDWNASELKKALADDLR